MSRMVILIGKRITIQTGEMKLLWIIRSCTRPEIIHILKLITLVTGQTSINEGKNNTSIEWTHADY